MKNSLGNIGQHFRNRSDSKGNRAAMEDGAHDPPVDGDDTTIVEPEQGNVLSHIIAQLRPGADLSRVTLPTFILEEKSMLERITNFMAHPEILLSLPEVQDPLLRFVSVVKFYLSGWHIKPPGVKKPLNPILGETFTCYWDYPDKTRGYYISEQTSHHPPKSSYFFMAPEHHIRIDGTLKPRSKFLGNSAASMMEGISYLRFTDRGKTPGGEKYILTQPNMYARGILFGKMKYELGDHAYIRCPEHGLSADVEFKTKGWVSGTYNAIQGTVKNEKTGEALYEFSGLWSGEMHVKDLKTGEKQMFFNASVAKHTPPLARPIEEQGERESQRLWQSTIKAIHVSDHATATDEKAKIEDRQRDEAKRREESGEEFHPKLFRRVNSHPGSPDEGEDDLEWIINANIDPRDPRLASQQILAIAPILPGQKPGRTPATASGNSGAPSQQSQATSANLPQTSQTQGAPQQGVPNPQPVSQRLPQSQPSVQNSNPAPAGTESHRVMVDGNQSVESAKNQVKGTNVQDSTMPGSF